MSDAPGEHDYVYARWSECTCDWQTKYCEDEHTRGAMVPLSVLRNYERSMSDV